MYTAKIVSRTILFIIFGFLIINGEIKIWESKKYETEIIGTVINTFVSNGRSSICFATIRLNNGYIEEVNTGHFLYNVGDKYISKLNWNPFFGLSGFAYALYQEDEAVYILSIIPAVFFHIFLCSLPILILLYFSLKS